MASATVTFEVGDYVKGKSIEYMNKIGKIVDIMINGRVTKFNILWTNKENAVVLAKDVWKAEKYEVCPEQEEEEYDSEDSSESEDEEVPREVSGKDLVESDDEVVEVAPVLKKYSIYIYFDFYYILLMYSGKKEKPAKVKVECDPLVPNGQVYTPTQVANTDQVKVFPRKKAEFHQSEAFNLIEMDDKLQPLDYWMSCMPPEFLREIVNATNEEIHRVRNSTSVKNADKTITVTRNADPDYFTNTNSPECEKNVTTSQMIKYLGLRLAMGLDPTRGDMPSYWNTDSDATLGVETIFTARNFGKYIKLNRFIFINRCFRLAKETERVVNVRFILQQTLICLVMYFKG